MTNMLKYLTITTFLAVTALVAGCNTTAGFGEDVESVGDAIEDTANDAKD